MPRLRRPTQSKEPADRLDVDALAADTSRFLACLGSQLRLLGELAEGAGAAVANGGSSGGPLAAALSGLENSNVALYASRCEDIAQSAHESHGYVPRNGAQVNDGSAGAVISGRASQISNASLEHEERAADEADAKFPQTEGDTAEHLERPKSKSQVSSAFEDIDLLRPPPLDRGHRRPGKKFTATAAEGCRRRLQEFVLCPAFDVTIGAVITANAATIGYGANREPETIPLPVVLLEYTFLIVYVVELCLRFGAFGMVALRSHWVKFDMVLVICGILDTLINGLKVVKWNSGSEVDVLGVVMLVRLLRLARLARLVRLFVQFKVLWLLVSGLLNSLMTLVWTFVIIALLLYLFALVGMELIQEDYSCGNTEACLAYNAAVSKNFSTLLSSILTLLMGLTLDSLGSIYRPIVDQKPYLFPYFVMFILIVSIALMNLVTALMVEMALTQAASDREITEAWGMHERSKVIVELNQVFKQLDADNSGTLDMVELTNGPEEVKARLATLARSEDPGREMVSIFKALDYDNSGQVAIDEFCQGLLRIQDGKIPLELVCIWRECDEILRCCRETLRYVR